LQWVFELGLMARRGHLESKDDDPPGMGLDSCRAEIERDRSIGTAGRGDFGLQQHNPRTVNRLEGPFTLPH
jgi:hypothetical protein